MNKSTLQNCTIEELLDCFENYCFAYSHNQTKINALAIDRIKEEIKRRIPHA